MHTGIMSSKRGRFITVSLVFTLSKVLSIVVIDLAQAPISFNQVVLSGTQVDLTVLEQATQTTTLLRDTHRSSTENFEFYHANQLSLLSKYNTPWYRMKCVRWHQTYNQIYNLVSLFFGQILIRQLLHNHHSDYIFIQRNTELLTLQSSITFNFTSAKVSYFLAVLQLLHPKPSSLEAAAVSQI